MNNSENKLVRLIDIIRKDSGINNAVDAMEQLSLLLLSQYFYEVMLVDSSKRKSMGDFSSLFFGQDEFRVRKIEENFSRLKIVFKDIIFEANSEDGGFYDDDSLDRLNKVNSLFNTTPFRIRSEKILEHVIHILNDISFGESLAEAYDLLVIRMIEDSISSGIYHSPKALVSAIVKVINPSFSDSIYDPALGTGRFIVEAHKLVSKCEGTTTEKSLKVFGQDISSFAHLVGTLNLLFNGVDIKGVSLGDSLLESDESLYDIILSGIPFGKSSTSEKYEYAYRGYNSSLEAMFLKHTMRKLDVGGSAALIVPDSFLFNMTSASVNLRKELLSKFNLHTILSLPPGVLSPYTGIKVSVLFFDRKPKNENVWLYQLNTERPLNKKNQLLDGAFKEFIDLFSARPKTANSCLVNKKTILSKKEINLQITLPSKSAGFLAVSIHDELKSVENHKKESDRLYDELTRSLAQADIGRGEVLPKNTIEQLFKIKSGKHLNRSDFEETGSFPVYGANGVVGNHNEFNLDGENILIGRVGAQCGNVYFVKGPIWFTSNTFCIHLKSDKNVFKPYLAHVLRSLKLNSLAGGAAQPSISYSSIKDIELALPEYKKQVELSQLFDEIQTSNTDLKKSLNLQIEKLNELASHSISTNCI